MGKLCYRELRDTIRIPNLGRISLNHIFIVFFCTLHVGYYPVLSKENSSILSIECPRTHYQPFGQMSNEFRTGTCLYEKSLCNDLGEETCEEGGSLEDRSCRCKYTDGYRSIESLLTLTNKSCYRPKYETNGCAYFTCPEDEELNPSKS